MRHRSCHLLAQRADVKRADKRTNLKRADVKRTDLKRAEVQRTDLKRAEVQRTDVKRLVQLADVQLMDVDGTN